MFKVQRVTPVQAHYDSITIGEFEKTSGENSQPGEKGGFKDLASRALSGGKRSIDWDVKFELQRFLSPLTGLARCLHVEV